MSKQPAKKKSTADRTTRPRGMRDITGEEFYTYQGFFEKAAEVALYYGFQPIETPMVEKEDVFTSSIGESTDIVEKEMYALKSKGGESLVLRPEGTAGIVRAYIEHGMHTLPQPVMLYYHGPFFRHEKPQRGRWRQFYQFGLETLGTEKSIADAVVIRVIVTILQEMGIKNLCVRINSIGDKECRVAYIKALTHYYKKHLGEVCANCRQRIKTNPLRLLDCNDPNCQKLKEEAPEMVSYLSESSKKHFKEVLEHLDTADTPYMIDHTLVRGLDYYTRTVFEVVAHEEECDDTPDDLPDEATDDETPNEETTTPENEDNDETPPQERPDNQEETPKQLALAGGGRYNDLAKNLGSKRDIPSIGAAIGVDRIVTLPDFVPHHPRIIKKPKIYFIQIGFEAKLKSLEVIELLRKAKIPVLQSLSKDKLSIQLAMAEKKAIPYTLILGQKEVIDGTIIVRDMDSHSQDTVKIEELIEYLKKK